MEHIADVGIETLRATRISLHQAVQAVSTLPRNLLSYDPTDGTASLEWNTSMHGLQSIAISSPEKQMLRTLLMFDSFELCITIDDVIVKSLSLAGQSTYQAMTWLKGELRMLRLPSDKIKLSLPYQIESYDYEKPLNVDAYALLVYKELYNTAYKILQSVVKDWEDAYDIRCWPHHFDLATLIPVESDDKGEILKSIGLGLSPGDNDIQEPYLYINVWPIIHYDSLNRYILDNGYWNKGGWSGAVLRYSDFKKSGILEDTFTNFFKNTFAILNDH